MHSAVVCICGNGPVGVEGQEEKRLLFCHWEAGLLHLGWQTVDSNPVHNREIASLRVEQQIFRLERVRVLGELSVEPLENLEIWIHTLHSEAHEIRLPVLEE